jgi:hypothetical protein
VPLTLIRYSAQAMKSWKVFFFFKNFPSSYLRHTHHLPQDTASLQLWLSNRTSCRHNITACPHSHQ